MTTEKQTLEDKQKRLAALEQERQELLGDLEGDRKAYKDLVAQRIPELVVNLLDLEEKLVKAKATIFEGLRDIVELKTQTYGIKDGQQSHTFRSRVEVDQTLPEGDYVIEIGYRINDAWDDTAPTGVAKVNEVIRSFVKDDNSKVLVDAIMRLLKRDKNGNLNSSRILELRKMADEIKNEALIDGINIIMNSHVPQRSNWFISAEKPDATKGTKAIGLSISAVPFPADFTFEFINNKVEVHA